MAFIWFMMILMLTRVFSNRRISNGLYYRTAKYKCHSSLSSSSLLSLSLSSLSSLSSSSSASSSPSPILKKNQHLIDGHICNEITVTLKNNLSITILEASAESQDKLVDIALESNDMVDPYGSVVWASSIIIAGIQNHSLPLITITIITIKINYFNIQKVERYLNEY